MNNKKYRLIISLISLLILSAIGLFAYENVFLVKQQQAQVRTIYIAKQDIQPYTAIKGDLFEAVSIPKDAVLNGYVTNINGVSDKELKGGLLKGEPLLDQRLVDKGSKKDGDLDLNIESDFPTDVKVGDIINVYVQYVDNKTKESTFYPLLKEKQIKELATNGSNNILNSQTKKTNAIVVSANEDELKKYFSAHQSGFIIIAKVGKLDVGSQPIASDAPAQEVTPPTTELTTPSVTSAAQNASKDKTDPNAQALMSYIVNDGDSLDSLSIKFKTNNQNLMNLNNGAKSFTPGTTITVPAI